MWTAVFSFESPAHLALRIATSDSSCNLIPFCREVVSPEGTDRFSALRIYLRGARQECVKQKGVESLGGA